MLEGESHVPREPPERLLFGIVRKQKWERSSLVSSVEAPFPCNSAKCIRYGNAETPLGCEVCSTFQ